MRIKLVISYEGTGFSGWQRQVGKPTVQAALEDAFFKISGVRVNLTGSGRTDEGVHAIAQVAHFDVVYQEGKAIAPQKLPSAFNYYLPNTVRVLSAEQVDENFHACTKAKHKTYIYDMYLGAQNPLLEKRALWLDKPIDFNLMENAALLFMGTHDFIAFRAKGSSAKTTVRTVLDCSFTKVELYGSSGYRFSITANGFLYKMVRMIVGATLKVGSGKWTFADINNMLNTTEEFDKKTPAPSHGLYLKKVEY